MKDRKESVVLRFGCNAFFIYVCENFSGLNMPSLLRIYVTMCRLRQSLGFGVHSPYIYALQSDVFRERRPYYAYRMIECLSGSHYARVNKLLFRLVNYLHPKNIIEVGPDEGQSLKCMSMARQQMLLCAVREEAEHFTTDMLTQILSPDVPLDFLYVTHPYAYADIYEAALPLVGTRSVFVFKDIHARKERSAWWRTVEQDATRTGITFDLYDVGLVFFDRDRPRRNYRMMF